MHYLAGDDGATTSREAQPASGRLTANCMKSTSYGRGQGGGESVEASLSWPDLLQLQLALDNQHSITSTMLL